MRKSYYLAKTDNENMRDFIVRAGETLQHYQPDCTQEVIITLHEGTFTGFKVYYEQEQPVYIPVYCLYCGDITYSMGVLGNIEHFRCRSCGLEYSRNAS